MGAHLAFVIGFGYLPRASLSSMVQAHGHLQLLGWTGLFIIAVSSHVLPRLTNAKPIAPTRLNFMLWSIVLGLLFRTLGLLLVAYGTREAFGRTLVGVSGYLEGLGIALYLFILAQTIKKHNPQFGAAAAAGIKPFMVTSLLGWLVFALGNILVSTHFALGEALLIDPNWNSLVNEIFITLVLLPVCFAFSVNTFPIFLRLRAPYWPVARVTLLYSVSAVVRLTTLGFYTAGGNAFWLSVSLVAQLIQGLSILWFIWELDIARRKAPWFKKFRIEDERESRPPRKKAADYGQFGNFEWLLYGAYVCLAAAALGDVIYAGFELLRLGSPIGIDIIRHLYLLGFVTQLILGMAVRKIPGFLGRSYIVFPSLVNLSWVFIVLAVLCRVVPPVFWGRGEHVWLVRAWGTSGIWGLLAVVCLAVNLIATAKD